MMTRARSVPASVLFAMVVGLAAMLSACAPTTRVVMLPQPGHDSTVEVAPRSEAPGAKAVTAASAAAKTFLLTKPYQTATVDAGDRVGVAQWDAARVQSRYGALLAAQPPAARIYQLYFQPNGTRLTFESAVQLDSVITLATACRGSEIVITGYTDRVGTAEVNDRLSLQRARTIRATIISRGFDPARVYAVGRGERDPVVPTADQVSEPKNRRVEITVR